MESTLEIHITNVYCSYKQEYGRLLLPYCNWPVKIMVLLYSIVQCFELFFAYSCNSLYLLVILKVLIVTSWNSFGKSPKKWPVLWLGIQNVCKQGWLTSHCNHILISSVYERACIYLCFPSSCASIVLILNYFPIWHIHSCASVTMVLSFLR